MSVHQYSSDSIWLNGVQDPDEGAVVKALVDDIYMSGQWLVQRELTTAEFAQEIGASAETVRAMIRDGLIAARKDGNRWMIPVAEVERFVSD